MKNKILSLLALFLLAAGNISSQNSTCANASPFCTGNTMQFPAGVNAGNAQPGPNYGCLGSQPNPAWFYFQAASSGPMVISMSAANDIDFICWGPFPNLNSCGNLTSATQVPGSGYSTPGTNGCSYSGSATETLTIANAVPGQFYIMLITNFSNTNQQITFQQSNANNPGAGTTNCGLICQITASNSGILCAGSNATLSATTGTSITSYTWTGPGGFTSNQLNPVVTNVQSAGAYTIVGANSSQTCAAVTTLTVTQPQSYTVVPQTATVCQGGIATPSVYFGPVLSGNPCSSTGVGPACASPNVIQVGTQSGQNTTFTYPAPYGNWYKNARHQMLFRASELTALGITQGYITSLAFNVSTISGTTNYPNYTIRLKCTNVTALSGAFDNAALTQVYNIANYNVTTGWNTHVFNTPYYWDGVSNLLVDVCYNLTANYTQNSISPYMTTPFNSCRVYYSDVIVACMTTNAPLQTNANRPLVRFGNCTSVNPNAFSYQWTQGPGIASPTASSTAITAQPITGSVASVVYSVVVTPTNINCPLQKTFTLTINNPATPTLSVPGPLCNTAGTVQLTATPSGGTWTNNVSVSPAGAMNPGLAPIGTSSVMYSVQIGSCTATSTANLNVSQFNTAAFSGTIAPLCVTSPTQNLMSIVQSTVGGSWSGTGVIGNYSFTPAGLATNTYSLYYNTVSTPNPTVCPSSNTLEVSVLNPPQPTITQVGPYCNTAPTVQVVVSPNTGTWTPVGYQTSTGIFDPSLAAIGSNTVQFVTGTFTCNAQATSTINVEAFVPATITGSISDKCNTAAQVNLTPLVANPGGTWSGPGVTGSMFDPTTSGTGVITLTYSTNSSPVGLCPDQDMLSVNVFSLATPVLTQIGPFCNMNGNVQIPVVPLGGTFFGSSGVVTTQGVFAPTQANIGANVISYSISSGPCVSTAQTTINVEKFVSADFSAYAGPFCKNDPVFNLNSIVQNPGGVWTGPGLSGSLFTPANANIGNNNIVIYSTHSVPTASLCPDTAAMRIQVNDIPKVSIVSNVTKGCLPVDAIFNTPNANTGSGEWNFGDGTPTQTGLSVNHQFVTAGSYTVTFTYQDEIGCKTQTTLPSPVNVYAMPHADFTFSPDEITTANPDVQFSNYSTVLGQNTYQWQIGNLYQLNDVNPKVVFPAAGDYNIILTATTTDGCVDVISKVVSVKNDYGVYIPSSFTPNFDGLNDEFRPVFSPYGLDLKVYDLEIFDRWGHSLFHTKDATVGWNGMAKGSDEPMKQDIYVYKIKFKDMDGKIHNKTGHVSLLK